jgi:hypothetical protein
VEWSGVGKSEGEVVWSRERVSLTGSTPALSSDLRLIQEHQNSGAGLVEILKARSDVEGCAIEASGGRQCETTPQQWGSHRLLRLEYLVYVICAVLPRLIVLCFRLIDGFRVGGW